MGPLVSVTVALHTKTKCWVFCFRKPILTTHAVGRLLIPELLQTCRPHPINALVRLEADMIAQYGQGSICPPQGVPPLLWWWLMCLHLL